MTLSSTRPIRPPARQQGVVLFIALIVLVAMTLTAIALMRSVDTTTAVAGNVAFKAATLHTSDRGLEAAYRWLVTNAGTAALNNDDTANGYYSSRPAKDPDWTDPASWTAALCVNGCAADANGNTTYYVIHRMCTEPSTAYNGVGGSGQANQCATLVKTTPAQTGGSAKAGVALPLVPPPDVYYRITARVVGPKNATSVVQSMIAVSN
jgi:type IV pilus assembly protein PilX